MHTAVRCLQLCDDRPFLRSFPVRHSLINCHSFHITVSDASYVHQNSRSVADVHCSSTARPCQQQCTCTRDWECLELIFQRQRLNGLIYKHPVRTAQ